MKLPLEAYQPGQTVKMARFFLGKFCFTRTREGVAGGIITETEAYGGAEDKACHGFGNRRTARTEVMFGAGGRAYVYLCYGLHYMLNFVTGPAGSPQATLIRGMRITEGKDLVQRRRKGITEAHWASGPGKVGAALGLGPPFQGAELQGNQIWVEDRGLKVSPREIQITPRIGVDYAAEWATKPWRFVWDPKSLQQDL